MVVHEGILEWCDFLCGVTFTLVAVDVHAELLPLALAGRESW